MKEYPHLDGVRLRETEGPNVWLVFQGKRHRICSPSVFNSLFAEADKLLYNEELDSIDIGPELNDGTCLVRFDGQTSIFLATGDGRQVGLLRIASFESFQDFAFDAAKVRDLPYILDCMIPVQGELTSAPDRVARGLP